MASWLPWRTNKDSEDSESLYDSEEESAELADAPQLTVYYKDDNFTFARMTMESIVNIPCWAFNRPLDTKRVNELCDGILSSNCVYGVFVIASKDDQMHLIDGQHRQQAIIHAWESNPDLDVAILTLIYNVETDEEIVELFKRVNNTKPLDPTETPNTIVMTATKKLGADYHDAILFNQNKTVYPYILAKDLQEKLKTIPLKNVTSDQLYKALRKLNNKYSKISVKSIPNVRVRLTKGAVAKAQSSGFYLGLDEKWSWIEELDELLQ